jgi:dUTPase
VEPERAKAMNKNAATKQVRAVLEKDPRSNLHRYPIVIAAQNGDLILTGEVESAVRLPLEKIDSSMRPRSGFTTKEWVVTMDGLVPNETMKQMAERAWGQ